MASHQILLADDQQDILDALEILLSGEGWKTTAVTSPHAVIEKLDSGDYDILLMDMNYARDTTGGVEGLDLLSRVQAVDPTLPVIVMTAWGSVEGAVGAMQRGAKDYITKPWENERLVHLLRTHIELGQAVQKTQRLESENQRLKKTGLPTLIASAPSMKPVLQLMERVAPSDANVLITGEHGTGKEVVANWMHAASDRSANSLVTVNAGGLSEGVFESEIFGHVKGAFTDAKTDRVGCFELADKGTLFLDEIGNVPMAQQAKLLRVLESGELQRVGSSKIRKVNVRVLSATNTDIVAAVEEGLFREDLLYRLNTVEINLPPLRDRREDIPLLAKFFLEQLQGRYGNAVTEFSEPAMQALVQHNWPGNVRELAHVIERAVLMSQGEAVMVHDLGLRSKSDGSGAIDGLTLDDAERMLIEKALQKFDGNVSKAAESLGLSRSALYRRMQRFDL